MGKLRAFNTKLERIADVLERFTDRVIPALQMIAVTLAVGGGILVLVLLIPQSFHN